MVNFSKFNLFRHISFTSFSLFSGKVVDTSLRDRGRVKNGNLRWGKPATSAKWVPHMKFFLTILRNLQLKLITFNNKTRWV